MWEQSYPVCSVVLRVINKILLLKCLTHPAKWKYEFEKNTCTPMLSAELLTISKIWKQPKYPSRNKWIKNISCPNHSVFGYWELFQLAYLSLCYISINTHVIFSSISLFSGILLLQANPVYFMPHCHNQLFFFSWEILIPFLQNVIRNQGLGAGMCSFLMR